MLNHSDVLLCVTLEGVFVIVESSLVRLAKSRTVSLSGDCVEFEPLYYVCVSVGPVGVLTGSMSNTSLIADKSPLGTASAFHLTLGITHDSVLVHLVTVDYSSS